MKNNFLLLEALDFTLYENVTADEFCGVIKDPASWKIGVVKQLLPEASWLWDNFRLFVELICVNVLEEGAIVAIVKKLILKSESPSILITKLVLGFELFLNQYNTIQSLPVGMDNFKAIIKALEQSVRFNEDKVITIVKELVASGAEVDEVHALVDVLIKLKTKIKLNVNRASLMKAVSKLSPNINETIMSESKIRNAIRLVLLESQKSNVYKYPGDNAWEYQKKGNSWYTRKSGSIDDFKIKIKDTETIGELNKNAKKKQINKTKDNETKDNKKEGTVYGTQEYIKVGNKEYLVLPDGIVWQTAGYNKKAPNNKADRSEVIEIGHINDDSLAQVKSGLIKSGFEELKSYKKVEKDNMNPIKRWFSMALTGPIPIFARAFAAYLTGRKKVWTTKEFKLDEYAAFKKLIVYALTPQGRHIANNAARLGIDNKGGLLSYGIYRLANDIHGYQSTGIFTGDGSKGFTGAASDGPFNSISKFAGGMNPESRGKISEYVEKVKNDEGFIMVLNDVYDFDEYESKRKIFDKNPDVFETVFGPAIEKAKKGGLYSGIRHAAGFKMAIKDKEGKYYEGFPIKLTVKITPNDIKKAKKALADHLGEVDDPEYYKNKSLLGTEKSREKEAQRKERETRKAPKPESKNSDDKSPDSRLPKPKTLSWIKVTEVTPSKIKGVLTKSGKSVIYKAGSSAYSNTIKDLKK